MIIYDKDEQDAMSDGRQAERDILELKAQKARELRTPAGICRRLSQTVFNIVNPEKPADDTGVEYNGRFKV